MELNSVGSINSFAGISGPGLRPPCCEDDISRIQAGNIENMDISNPGKIMSAVSQMSEEEKDEIKAFNDEIMAAVKDGTFDASEMAENAPESLTALSEETGIDLEQMIEDMASGPQGKRGAPPPPPPMMGGLGDSELSEEEIAELEAFREEIMNALSDGSFDASEMAENAPESLVNLAEENGFDLEQMIEDMAQGPQGPMGAPPPPPPMMYNANGEGLSFYDEEDTNLLSGLILSDDSDQTEQV